MAVSGVKGGPPPPTTKAAIFYHGGYQSQLLLNATGYNTDKKWKLLELQVRRGLKAAHIDNDFATLEFQMSAAPPSLLAHTDIEIASVYLSLIQRLSCVVPHIVDFLLKPPRKRLCTGCLVCSKTLPYSISPVSIIHSPQPIPKADTSTGLHFALDMRTALPLRFLAYYPSLYAQDDLEESVTIIGSAKDTILAGHPPRYEELGRRDNYDTKGGRALSDFGPTKSVPLGDIVLGRSGDKGSNLNCGLFVRDAAAWEWLRVFLSKDRFIQLLGQDWSSEYFLERVEFSKIRAVHFVIYGILGRGVSGSSRLDCLGKGFADFFRDKHVDVPQVFLEPSKSVLTRIVNK